MPTLILWAWELFEDDLLPLMGSGSLVGRLICIAGNNGTVISLAGNNDTIIDLTGDKTDC